METILAQIQKRCDTWDNWVLINPVLAAAEDGYVISGLNAGRTKTGNGVTPWNNLPFNDNYAVDKINLLNTALLNETAAREQGDGERIKITEMGAAGGVATLDENKKLTLSQLPPIGDPDSEFNYFLNAVNDLQNDIDKLKSQPVTHSELLDLIVSNSLITGVFYLITDFKTIYKQPQSNIISNSSAGIEAGLDTPIEPLIVFATSENTLGLKAFSPLYPQDEIWYDVTQNNTALYEWAVENDCGQIYRRVTKNKNDFPYDVRNIKYRRWALNTASIPLWSSTVTYGVRADVLYNNVIYRSTIPSSFNNIPSALGAWIVLLDATTIRQFISWSPIGFDTSFSDGWYFGGVANINMSNKIPIDTNTYKDFYTFDDGNGANQIEAVNVHNNKIGEYKVSGVLRLNNSIFIGNNFNSNTVGNNFNSNTVGNNFNSNTVGNNFNSNTVGNSFQYNTVGNNFNSNTVGNSFQYNTVGNSFGSNTIGNSFQSNTVGNNFNSNTVGNNFNSNTVGNNFNSNTVGNSFQYNTVGNSFQYNTVGNNFQYNTVGNSFQYNTVGNNFNSNTVGNNFNSNTVGNFFYFNRFGDNFQYQTMNSSETSSSSQVRNNEFGNGISVTKNWGNTWWDDIGKQYLLAAQTVRWSATGSTTAVAYSFQNTAGTFITGVV